MPSPTHYPLYACTRCLAIAPGGNTDDPRHDWRLVTDRHQFAALALDAIQENPDLILTSALDVVLLDAQPTPQPTHATRMLAKADGLRDARGNVRTRQQQINATNIAHDLANVFGRNADYARDLHPLDRKRLTDAGARFD
jgi:hypothetical protein